MAQDAIINRWDINGDVYDIQDAGRGRPLGVATLDENGRVPYTQLPESAVEFKGYWNADTNTPTLHDGTGTKGDLYYVDVAGTQDLGSGSQVFEVGDRVLYDGSVWKNMKSGGTDIEVYPTMADLQQDLPNLEDGTIVATEEGDNFTTVDAVQSGVFNPVTSNAVAQILGSYRKRRTAQFYWANNYSSGYVRFLVLRSGSSTANHDCSVAGIIRNCPPSNVWDFYFNLQCRGNNTTIQYSRFSVFALNGGTKPSYVATRKLNGTQFVLTLYVPFASWKLDFAEILYVTGGDVFQPLDLQTDALTFPMQWVSAIPSDETQITMT